MEPFDYVTGTDLRLVGVSAARHAGPFFFADSIFDRFEPVNQRGTRLFKHLFSGFQNPDPLHGDVIFIGCDERTGVLETDLPEDIITYALEDMRWGAN